MPNYTINPNDPNTLTCELSGVGAATSVINLSGVTVYDHTGGYRGLNPTDGWAAGAVFTVGAGTNEYEITAIEVSGSGHLFTITPAFASPESSGANSGHTVTRKWHGTHKSYKEHIRLYTLGHI